MKPKIETPDNPIPELHTSPFKAIVCVNVDWEYFAVLNERPHLPADAPVFLNRVDQLPDDLI
jgi:hypothetical protein